MTSQQDTELRELAERFAKDFDISYDKISIRKSHVAYRFDTTGSGGWTEGTPATVVDLWIIKKHYELLEALTSWKDKEVKKAKLKAKIKELHNVLNTPGTRAEPNGHKRRKRIKLLEKQLESLQSQGGKNE